MSDFNWVKEGACYVAHIFNDDEGLSGDIRLWVVPKDMRYGKAARGTKWRAGVSIWDERTRTMSRFGRDVYMEICPTFKDAMRLAELVYKEAKDD